MEYAEALAEQDRLLGELVRDADPAIRVPTCPDWTLRQLLNHVGRGHRWAAAIVGERNPAAGVDPRSVPDGRAPDDPAAALAWLVASGAALVDAVAVDPDVPVWTFTGPQPAAWWIRRRLHESTVHRADAAIAVGVPYELAPELAADGVSEWLGLLASRRAGEGPAALDPGATLHLHATDDGLGPDGEWMIRGAGERITWEPGHGKGDAAVRGPAVDLLLASLRRIPAGSVEVLGDEGTWTTWLERTGF